MSSGDEPFDKDKSVFREAQIGRDARRVSTGRTLNMQLYASTFPTEGTKIKVLDRAARSHFSDVIAMYARAIITSHLSALLCVC